MARKSYPFGPLLSSGRIHRVIKGGPGWPYDQTLKGRGAVVQRMMMDSRSCCSTIRAQASVAFPDPAKGETIQELTTVALAPGMPDSTDHL
jgi:hypothetical protein